MRHEVIHKTPRLKPQGIVSLWGRVLSSPLKPLPIG